MKIIIPMAFRNRINRLENVVVPTKVKGEPFYISEELYNKLDIAQRMSLPAWVKIILSPDTMKKIRKEIEDAKAGNYQPAYRSDEEREKGVKDFRDCYEKYGGLLYDWTPERLKKLKAGKVPQ